MVLSMTKAVLLVQFIEIIPEVAESIRLAPEAEQDEYLE